MKKLLLYAIGLLFGLVLLYSLIPNSTIDWTVTFHAGAMGDDLDAYLASEEAAHSGITPGAEKRIVWAGAPNARTELAIIFLHGFSATSRELAPVHERVAAQMGANLYLARLTGHGQDGAALAEATAGQWHNDLLEAIEIGRRIGEKTVILSSSTGGTLAALATLDLEAARTLKGIVFVSPNFGLQVPAAFLLHNPLGQRIALAIAGEQRSWTPSNAEHAKWWTNSYPTRAVFPMATLVHTAASADYSSVFVPALFVYADNDIVVDPDATRRVMAGWGARADEWLIAPGEGIDPDGHVLMGDIKSPGLTQEAVERLVAWIGGL